MEARDGCATRVVTDDAETFGLQNLQATVSRGGYVAPDGGSIRKCRADE